MKYPTQFKLGYPVKEDLSQYVRNMPGQRDYYILDVDGIGVRVIVYKDGTVQCGQEKYRSSTDYSWGGLMRWIAHPPWHSIRSYKWRARRAIRKAASR